ncbi:prealbumin-like fold domain-containing protein [Enterococcus hulanensis]|uniref:prealbumin-like fold domain-containing protein n=1 Tax=Enterococcus hulanensis TaxID=2559929 RepID=UPI0010F8E2C8|nr:prealbumin-like fold domain-containing protein [Enterococcus hulanensis]
MRKPNQLKRMVPLLLPVVLIIGVLFFYYHGKALKASTPDALVSVTVGNEAVQNDSLTTEKETVELTLQAKETDIFELPYDDTVSVTPLDEEGQETTYPQLASSDVKKSQALKLFKERLKTTDTSDSHEAKKEETTKTTETAETTEDTNKRLPYYQVRETDDKGSFYFELEKEQTQRVRITRLTKKKQTVNLASLTDTNLKQPIVVFKATEQLTETPPEIPEAPESQEPVSDENQEEPAEPTTTENEETTEEAKEPAAEKAAIKPQAASMTDPFKVTVDVGKKTGTEPFDKEIGNEPGYDKDELNDIVRTFDEVSYELTLGISTLDEKYASVRIRLDIELPDAWRKDSSGQVRQVAEFSNGTLVNTGNGTKKSIRSTYQTAEKGSGIQAYFGETIEVKGGVNGWELNPKFTLVIESATLKDGSEVKINQEIDSTVKPELAEQTKVTISAKPLVDVKMAWTPNRMSNFEKTTGSTDKPHTMITNVGAYVQLKPLPGRSDLTSIKGSTYPVGGIEYKIEQQMIYTNENTGKSKDLVIGVDNNPMQVITYDGLPGWDMNSKRKFTSEFDSYKTIYNPIIRQGLATPVGYTRGTFPPSQGYSTGIGIYDTGNPVVTNNSDYSIAVSNQDYIPISVGKNKWLLSGTQMASNAEPFSVVAMQVLFPYEYLNRFPGVNGNINYKLTVNKIKYKTVEEGVEKEVDQKVESTLNMIWDKKWPGTIKTYSATLNSATAGLSTNPDSSRGYASAGDSITTQGNKIWGSFYSAYTDIAADTSIMYSRWNANSVTYDNSRRIVDKSNGGNLQKLFYGVGSKFPDMTLRKNDDIDQEYSWYSTPEEALANGEIVAIKTLFKVTDSSGSGYPRIHVPLIANGKIGAADSMGNANIFLTNVFNFEIDGKTLSKSYPTDSMVDYRPTTYNDKGILQTSHSPTSDWGDTLYIAGMTIRPTISTDEKVYSPNDIVKWTVDGKVESGSENKHKVQFAVTIPKETQYIDETAKDYQGNPLPDPSSRVENADGTWTLKWVLDYTAEGSTYNPKVTFDTSIISSKLTFISNSAQLDGKVVADVWLEEDKNVRDTSDEQLRTSTANATVTNSGVIVVDKVVDKPYIESGNEIDPAKPSDTNPTDFTYTISFKNHSTKPMDDVRVLDVLPFNGDQRGTDFNGSYSVTEVKQMPGSVPGTIWYRTSSGVGVNTDPNDVILTSSWYKLGSNMEVLKNAKAIIAVYDKLDPGEDMALTITLRPDGQQAGDKYVNSPALNSRVPQHVQGVPSSVRVYGRDLSGVAWYDDNLDGLIGNKPAGGAEEWAKDIPVKLYRTSLEVPSYTNKLVEESLTGEKFIDPSGNSLVKTDTNGKYQFNNLPEGNYLAEFVIGDKVVQREFRVTKKEAGSDESLNSKADQTTYKTKDFAQPILSEVAGLGATDSKNHVEHVNLGLVRPSTIRLFKFATGTAIDGDGDGKLSEAEKATGTPLKNAEFEVYEGDASSPFAKETTDESGNLSFVKLFPGEHTLIETKAPEGYELIKSPIKVTITEGNQTIQVYQEDDKKTDLPFTGGTGPMLLLLIIVSGMGILGLGGLYWYYRQPSRKGEG